MRRAFALTSLSIGLSAAIACAASDEEAGPPSEPPGTTVPDEAGAPDTGSADAPAPVVPTCSSAGWCLTTLPDADLTLKDIWPFASRAFAIAESPTLGVKVLEWDDAAASWSYIDDDTQNSFAFESYAGKIWAPGEDEVYFASGPGFVYHGKRSAPAAPWSWERSQLEDNANDGRPDRDHGRVVHFDGWGVAIQSTALGVWGTAADDVYAWYSNTVFHWESAGGGPAAWVPVHVVEDPETPDDSFFIFGAGGSGKDDVWFAAGRGRFDAWNIFRCPVVLHRSPSGFERLVDTAVDPSDIFNHHYNTCRQKPDVMSFSWSNGRDMMHWANAGWPTSIESAGPGRAVAIMGSDRFAYVESGDAPMARLNRVVARVPRDAIPELVSSVWVNGSDAWISGWGLLLKMPVDAPKWSTGFGLYSKDGVKEIGLDAATYELSPTAINGAPLDRPLYQVRGTSNSNLWAIGHQHALHKTTP